MTRTLDDAVRPALRAVARQQPYFTKREVVHAVIQRAGVADAVIAIRREYRGRGLDGAILGYIEAEVSKALRARDGNGLRVYECYTVPPGDRRWRLLRNMTATDLRLVIADVAAQRDRLDAKLRAYQIILTNVERAGDDATVADVYDRSWATIVGANIPVSESA